jgi:hypothetical protein
MNEQINELIKQAAMRPACTGDWYSMSPAMVEHFAQSIVRECMDIYSRIDNGNLHLGTDNYLEALGKTFWS